MYRTTWPRHTTLGNTMKTISINGFAHWASYLVNADASSLDAADIDAVTQWARDNGVSVHNCLSADEDGIGWVKVDGREIMGDCAYYTFSIA